MKNHWIDCKKFEVPIPQMPEIPPIQFPVFEITFDVQIPPIILTCQDIYECQVTCVDPGNVWCGEGLPPSGFYYIPPVIALTSSNLPSEITVTVM